MPLIDGRGPILEWPADVRVCTVNCVGVMGAGLALAFARGWPALERDYKVACKRSQIRPGDVWTWHAPDGQMIICAATKDHWRRPSRYDWVESCLSRIRERVFDGELHVALPALGCGLGGLRWRPEVRSMVQTWLGDLRAQIAVFEPEASR